MLLNRVWPHFRYLFLSCQEVVKGYQTVFQQLEKTERRYQVPDLFLDLARGMMSLGDKSLSKKLAEESVQSWLRLRGISV